MNEKLEKGKKIRFILYNGTSNVEAEIICKFLERHQVDNTPIPLDTITLPDRFKGSDLSGILIQDATIEAEVDPFNGATKYKITLEGELI